MTNEEANKIIEKYMIHDAISRRDALSDDACKGIDCDECPFSYGLLCKLHTYISDLPTVIPKQRTGHWIYQEGYGPYKWKCNQCSVGFKTDFNYCPNCGAKKMEDE